MSCEKHTGVRTYSAIAHPLRTATLASEIRIGIHLEIKVEMVNEVEPQSKLQLAGQLELVVPAARFVEEGAKPWSSIPLPQSPKHRDSGRSSFPFSPLVGA